MSEDPLITTQTELDEAIDESKTRPVLIFKHSLACGISSSILGSCRSLFSERIGDGLRVAVIPVQNARDVSTELAERTGVRHETPQVLLLKDGRAVWTASHWDISPDSVERALESVATA